ncbi:MAG: winged helix-turn-helix domain-containing protein [Bacteroidota bacterium]
MSKRTFYLLGVLTVLIFFTWSFSDSNEDKDEFSEKVKISLRDVGNQLLLSHQDSTSLVLPVIQIAPSKYVLAFEPPLSFEPGSLVSIVDKSFRTSNLPTDYRVEVIQCTDHEVAYSYEKNAREEKTIVPCGGRFLPENCYRIEVRFVGQKASFFSVQNIGYLLIVIVFLLLVFFYIKSRKTRLLSENDPKHSSIGSFRFYPEQNKLVKEAMEISLSKKECELLEIFVANPNQIVKRDELTKKVWEDNGVIVGRSLDTYISKLRKKLKDDTSIKLTNVHGVGYKLEIHSNN